MSTPKKKKDWMGEKKKRLDGGEYGRDGAGQREAAAGCRKRMFSYIHIEEKEAEDADGGKYRRRIPENPTKNESKTEKSKKNSEIQEKYNGNTMRDPTINRKKMGPAGKNPP